MNKTSAKPQACRFNKHSRGSFARDTVYRFLKYTSLKPSFCSQPPKLSVPSRTTLPGLLEYTVKAREALLLLLLIEEKGRQRKKQHLEKKTTFRKEKQYFNKLPLPLFKLHQSRKSLPFLRCGLQDDNTNPISTPFSAK